MYGKYPKETLLLVQINASHLKNKRTLTARPVLAGRGKPYDIV